MRSKKFKRALCFALATGVFLTTPINLETYPVYAAAAVSSVATGDEVYDGVYDEWKLDEQCTVGGETLENAKGELNFASGPRNGNGTKPGSYPAVALNPHEFDFSKAGHFSFKVRGNSEKATTRFGIYLGYTNPGRGMFVGYDSFGWFWQKYNGRNDDYLRGDRNPSPKKGVETAVDISWTGDKKLTVTVNGEEVFKDLDCSEASWDGNKIAFKAGTYGQDVTDVTIREIKYTDQEPTILQKYEVSGKVTDEDGAPLAGAEIYVDGVKEDKATGENGEFSVRLLDGSYVLKFTKTGYDTVEKEVEVNNGAVSELLVKLESLGESKTDTISSEDMDVTIDTTFPRVVQYQMKKGSLKDKVFYGQPELIRSIKINGKEIKVKKTDVTSEIKENTVNYTIKVKKGEEVDAVIKAFLKVEKNTLAFEITEITNNLDDKANPVETIEIPNHGLISVREDQENFSFRGALMSSNTTIDGDESLTEFPEIYRRDFMYAFISADGMSAGLWSNSENDGSNKASNIWAGGASNTRIMALKGIYDDKKTLSLSSTKWYYHRKVTDSHDRVYVVSETEMPKAKIVITGDENEDNVVDWQDGAIAFRSIMNNPYKSEEVPELVAHRIAMNFGGQAQNPFLTTLDNVKRVALHTDGLGQSVILKGYANEGHDSGHPDYYDIGKRIGGAKDMNTLMEKGKALGARFGIHINCGEMYPEAKAFNDDSVRRDNYGNLRYGWNWIDQGVGLDSVYDLATGNRAERFDKLKDLVKDNLDYVYVDIWGNMTGGSDDTWQTRKLSKEINDRGWRMTTEWGPTNEYDSTFQHWAADLTYGGYKAKGENSVLMRFLRNHQKDSWVANYHKYGGAALAPLLGGYNMKDFEGWQGRNDYDAYIQNLYEHNLTTKFIQHFKVVKWEQGTPFLTGGENYTPDKKITLKNDEGDVLVLERVSDDSDSDDYYKRIITLNGKVIATGAEPERYTGNGSESYLLPWVWDAATGKRVAANDEKLYYFNNQKGETTWELPDSWKTLSEVKIYKLTDLGKKEEKTIPVVDGKITITAEAKQPYVVYKGSRENMAVKWSEGMHLVDAGFNSGNFDSWTKTGTGEAEIAKSQYSNPMMKLTGEVGMSQKLTDLTPGMQYAVLVGVDNRSDSKAVISITDGEKKLAENYTLRSIAKNYVKAYTHNTHSATVDGTSYFQNMYVFFTAPASGEATLTLSKLEGEGASYFDDVRVVESDAKNITFDKNGEISRFTQDFEKSVQGLYPFVVGGIEGVEDNRIHLSELHAPYTQAGWDVKKMDDVLDGNWSVKINGLTRRNAIAFQTIPQNFRFEPGVKYHVSFKYQSGTDGIYAVVKGSGEKITSNPEPLALAMGEDADATYETDIVGDESGQTWFGIYSTGKAANTQGNSGAAANFGGYQDFVLDDLVIERVDEVVTEDELKTLIEKAKSELTKENLSNSNYKKALEAIAKAEVALKEDGKSQKGINIAYNSLKELMKALEGSSKEADPDDASNDLPLDGMVAEAGSIQAGYQGEGPAELAIDGNENTIWHTNWSGTTLAKMWLDIRLKEATTVAGVRLLQRGGGGINGRIAKAEIKVLKKGETEYKTVKTVTLKSSGWNLVTFDAEKYVTNVKIQALQTLGSPENYYAALAEVRVVKEAKEEDEKPDKSELESLVKKAEELKANNEASNNVAVLEEKIKEAKAALAKEDATYFDILLAQANLKKVVNDLKAGVYKKAEEKPVQKPATDPNAIPVIPVQVIIPNEAANPSQTVDVNEDDTAKGSAGNGKKAALLKKDKRILKALKEVKTETKAIKTLVRSKKLNILANLKNYRKAAKNDKKLLSSKKDVNSAISYLEKNKITTSKSLLKRLTKLNKGLKKLQASKKNAKNEARIKKVQEEIASIKLVIISLKNAKKFFEK